MPKKLFFFIAKNVFFLKENDFATISKKIIPLPMLFVL
jgi:hypothetical protein